MKVVQTSLTEAEHKMLEKYARENSKTIKQVLREAVRKIVEGCIDPHDPVFTEPPSAKRTGRKDRGSIEHDKYLYSEDL